MIITASVVIFEKPFTCLIIFMEKLFDLSLSVIIFLVDLKDMSVISGSFTSILKGKAESRPRICFLESAIMGLKWEKGKKRRNK